MTDRAAVGRRVRAVSGRARARRPAADRVWNWGRAAGDNLGDSAR